MASVLRCMCWICSKAPPFTTPRLHMGAACFLRRLALGATDLLPSSPLLPDSWLGPHSLSLAGASAFGSLPPPALLRGASLLVNTLQGVEAVLGSCWLAPLRALLQMEASFRCTTMYGSLWAILLTTR